MCIYPVLLIPSHYYIGAPHLLGEGTCIQVDEDHGSYPVAFLADESKEPTYKTMFTLHMD
jgi:hypothetical protein